VAGGETTLEGVPGRYAAALFELAREEGALDRIGGELEQFSRMLDESPELLRLVRSPVFSAAEQMRALNAVLERAGIGGLTANFLGLVARNRRLFAVREMITAYRKLLARHRGEVTAEVVSAHRLSEEQVDSLAAVLKQKVGHDIRLDTRVDPSILGGLVVKVGSRMIDNSLRTKLENLRVAMKEVG